MTSPSILLLSFLFLSLSLALPFADGEPNALHFHFYMHFVPRKTEVLVAESNITVPGSLYNFGSIVVIDGLLTKGINITSNPVGKVQGLYSAMNSPTFVWSANIVFTAGEYNGSSFAILGPDDVTEPVREVAIVGGRGSFRRAQGYIQVKTVFFNVETGDAEAEVDAYVYPHVPKQYVGGF